MWSYGTPVCNSRHSSDLTGLAHLAAVHSLQTSALIIASTRKYVEKFVIFKIAIMPFSCRREDGDADGCCHGYRSATSTGSTRLCSLSWTASRTDRNTLAEVLRRVTTRISKSGFYTKSNATEMTYFPPYDRRGTFAWTPYERRFVRRSQERCKGHQVQCNVSLQHTYDRVGIWGTGMVFWP